MPPRYRVALCDDAADFVELLTLVFRVDEQFEVVGCAYDGLAAVELCATLKPDALLLDVSMPQMDGLTALPLIRRASPSTRVIMVSGFGSAEVAATALERGAVSWVEKGASPSALRSQVKLQLAGLV